MFGLMPGTISRWKKEGFPKKLGESDVTEYFGFDPKPITMPFSEVVQFDPPFNEQIIEENNRYIIKTDGLGRVTKLMKDIVSVPLAIDNPIKNPKDWEKLKGRLKFSKRRLKINQWLKIFKEAENRDLPVRTNCKGFFWFPRELMGLDGLFKAYFKWPKLVHEILNNYCELIINVAEYLLDHVEIDLFCFAEDMCYKKGMMISTKFYREFIEPYYKIIFKIFGNKGTKLFAVDSDGNLEDLIPLLIESGVNVVYPLEVQASNDIVSLREKFGKNIAFIGGLDKKMLIGEFADIDKELTSKIPSMKKTAGYIAGLDHRVPKETPFRSFKYYVNSVKSLLL
jgi:uroporphyrinogen decarboxylase